MLLSRYILSDIFSKKEMSPKVPNLTFSLATNGP
jgi:hypothetical protein